MREVSNRATNILMLLLSSLLILHEPCMSRLPNTNTEQRIYYHSVVDYYCQII